MRVRSPSPAPVFLCSSRRTTKTTFTGSRREISGTIYLTLISDNPDRKAILAVLMSNNTLAKLLTDTLPSGLPTLFNPWRDRCADDKPCNGPDAKLARLAAHLDCDPEFVLCGEAAGYLGCRHSGIAFTSEHLLLEEGKIPRMSPVSHRLTIKKGPYKEGSATTVWKELYRLGIQERTVRQKMYDSLNSLLNRKVNYDRAQKFLCLVALTGASSRCPHR